MVYWPYHRVVLFEDIILNVSLHMSFVDVTSLPFQQTNLSYTIQHNISLEKLERQLNSDYTSELVEILYNYNHVQSG